jgi:hypothetical protein
MAGFFENLLKDAAGGFFGSDYLRDYTHASKTFRPNAYQYAPKFKFLFHVYFEINPSAYAVGLPQDVNFGLAVKSVKLPSYNFDTHTMNQYNRKRIVQTKIKYDPIDINFHDDNGNSIRNMWYNYYTYYYKDASKPVVSISGRQAQTSGTSPNNSNYNKRNIYSQSITGDTDWGYVGETSDTVASYTEVGTGQTKIPFFKNITVFGFNQHNYVAYTLVNPIITRFAHDTYTYSEGNGVMENTMTLDYETVKYFQGAIDGKEPSNIVAGFGLNNHYDRVVSPIARPGSQSSILGQGGLVDGIFGTPQRDANGNIILGQDGKPIYTSTGFIEDLTGPNQNVLGAIQKAGTTYNTLKNMDLKQAIKSEVTTGITNAIMNPVNNTGRNVLFNTLIYGSTPNPNQTPKGRAVTPPPINN